MSLPEWTTSGLLPAGVHRTDLPGVYQRFVLDAPHLERRELLFEVLTVYLRVIQTIIPAGLAWIDGSFGRRSENPPEDVDIVIIPADWRALQGLSRAVDAKMYALITLLNACATHPAFEVDRLQPVGGVIDAFVCSPGGEDFWRGEWSRVLDKRHKVVAGALKGFAEVAW